MGYFSGIWGCGAGSSVSLMGFGAFLKGFWAFRWDFGFFLMGIGDLEWDLGFFLMGFVAIKWDLWVSEWDLGSF